MILRALFVIGGVLVLAACGRVGPLEPPPPKNAPAEQASPDAEPAPQPPRRIFLDRLI